MRTLWIACGAFALLLTACEWQAVEKPAGDVDGGRTTGTQPTPGAVEAVGTRVTNISSPEPFYETQRSIKRFLAATESPLPRDGWGVVVVIEGEQIRSSGPDGRFNTRDDISFGPDGEFLPPERPSE